MDLHVRGPSGAVEATSSEIHLAPTAAEIGSVEGGRQIWLVQACTLTVPSIELFSLRVPLGNLATTATEPS
jgi:hypothetical protein